MKLASSPSVAVSLPQLSPALQQALPMGVPVEARFVTYDPNSRQLTMTVAGQALQVRLQNDSPPTEPFQVQRTQVGTQQILLLQTQAVQSTSAFVLGQSWISRVQPSPIAGELQLIPIGRSTLPPIDLDIKRLDPPLNLAERVRVTVRQMEPLGVSITRLPQETEPLLSPRSAPRVAVNAPTLQSLFAHLNRLVHRDDLPPAARQILTRWVEQWPERSALMRPEVRSMWFGAQSAPRQGEQLGSLQQTSDPPRAQSLMVRVQSLLNALEPSMQLQPQARVQTRPPEGDLGVRSGMMSQVTPESMRSAQAVNPSLASDMTRAFSPPNPEPLARNMPLGAEPVTPSRLDLSRFPLHRIAAHPEIAQRLSASWRPSLPHLVMPAAWYPVAIAQQLQRVLHGFASIHLTNAPLLKPLTTLPGTLQPWSNLVALLSDAHVIPAASPPGANQRPDFQSQIQLLWREWIQLSQSMQSRPSALSTPALRESESSNLASGFSWSLELPIRDKHQLSLVEFAVTRQPASSERADTWQVILRMEPEAFGLVEVHLWYQAAQLKVHFFLERSSAMERLQDAVDQLSAGMHEGGASVLDIAWSLREKPAHKVYPSSDSEHWIDIQV